jgi:hypothetical protein
MESNSHQIQYPLPNATATLVLGILSLVGCFCYGVLGIIFGIIALVLGSKDMKLYASNPNQYTLSSYNNVKAGRICGIIGIILSILAVVVTIVMLILGTTPEFMEALKQFD